jgi:hypothetical protein
MVAERVSNRWIRSASLSSVLISNVRAVQDRRFTFDDRELERSRSTRDLSGAYCGGGEAGVYFV